MKTITVPVGNRIHYFNDFLKSLCKNDLHGYVIYFAFEPDAFIGNGIEATSFIDNLCACLPIEVKITLNTSKLGVRKNPFSIIEKAFDDGSEFNIHLEDDIKLSPDAICLANWYYEKFKHSNEYSAYGFFNKNSSYDSYEKLTVVKNRFFGLGWCCYKRDWIDIFKKYWFDDNIASKHFGRSKGWDWAVSGAFIEFGKKQLLPTLSRSIHIGREGGTHCTAKYHDKIFSNFAWNEHKVIKEFELWK